MKAKVLKRRLLSLIMSFMLIFTMVPDLGLTVLAAEDADEEAVFDAEEADDTEDAVAEEETADAEDDVTAEAEDADTEEAEAADEAEAFEETAEEEAEEAVEAEKEEAEVEAEVEQSDADEPEETEIADPEGATEYKLWVGGEQVTSVNKDNIHMKSGSATYNPATKTLNFEGDAKVDGSHSWSTGYGSVNAAIYTEDDLKITGSLTTAGNTYGVYSKEGTLTISGNLTLSAERTAVYVEGAKLIFEGGRADLTSNSGTSTGDFALDLCIGALYTSGTEKPELGDGIYVTSPATFVNMEKDKNDHYTAFTEKTGSDPLKHVVIEEAYGVWVGETAVTPANKSDVLGNGKVKYDEKGKVLTFSGNTTIGKGYESTVGGYNFGIFTRTDLTLRTLYDCSVVSDYTYGAIADLTFDGNFKTTSKAHYGVYVWNAHDLTINKGLVNLMGGLGAVKVTYGKINLKSDDGIELLSDNCEIRTEGYDRIVGGKGSTGPSLTAAFGKKYDLYVGGKQVTDLNRDNIDSIPSGKGSAYYDPETQTLDFDNVTAISGTTTYNGKTVLIHSGIAGLSITGKVNIDGGSAGYAIVAHSDEDDKDTELFFEKAKFSVTGVDYGIKSGNIEVHGGEINITDCTNMGIIAAGLKADGGTEVYVTAQKHAIQLSGALEVGSEEISEEEPATTAKISASSTDKSENSYSGIVCDKDVDLYGGSIAATAFSDNGKGLSTLGNVYVYGGTLSLIGDGKYGIGLSAGEIVFHAGKADLSGSYEAVQARKAIVFPEDSLSSITQIDGSTEGEIGTSAGYTTVLNGSGKPATAVTIEETTAKAYDLWVGGVPVTEANKGNIGDYGVAYDPATKTLSFTPPALSFSGIHTDDTWGSAVIYAKGDLTIDGGSGTAFTDGGSGADHYIFVQNGKLTLKGSLQISTGTTGGIEASVIISDGDISIENENTGLSDTTTVCRSNGSISVNSGTLEVNTTTGTVLCAKGDIVLATGMSILEPADGKMKSVQKGVYHYTYISDSNDQNVKHVKIGSETAKEYFTVSYNAMGGTPVPASAKVEKGSTVEKPADPTKEGLVFTGWYTEESCENEYVFTTAVTKDLTLYAGWKDAATFTVSFNLGTVTADPATVPKEQSVAEGQKATRPATDPTAAGVEFIAWCTTAAGDVEFDFDAPITADTVIYARWSAAGAGSLVSFDLQGGTGDIPTDYHIPDGSKVTRPANDPVKAGFEFAGWYVDAEGTSVYDFDTPVTGDVTIFAKWVKKAGPVTAGSALNNTPEIDDDTEEIWLVKGQKFIIADGWTVKSTDKESKKIVSISKKGVFKAKKNGEAIIYLGERQLKVHVSTPAVEKKWTLTIENADTMPTHEIVRTIDAGLASRYWYSASPDVATVDQDGNVTAVAKGKAKISCYINGKAYTCTVTVKEKVAPKERTLHLNLDGHKKLSVTGAKRAVWSSEDDTAAPCIKNKVTAKKAGTVKLTASENGAEVQTVELIAEDISLETGDVLKAARGANKYTAEITTGSTLELQFASVDQAVVFKSSKPDFAFVDEDGTLIAKAAGKTKLTAKINGKTVTINVVVTAAK
ncbi:MAG: InlB B-repeat-containing protein [Lachnospiraceae bacterium]|nr:InlB B-repeat-containing protein [Lachnospiraceae bacterium]